MRKTKAVKKGREIISETCGRFLKSKIKDNVDIEDVKWFLTTLILNDLSEENLYIKAK